MRKILTFLMPIFLLNNLYCQEYKWTFSAGAWVDDSAIGLESDSDSNVYLTGHLNFGTTIGDTTFNDWGAYLVKFSNTGIVKWATSFGTSDTFGVDIAIDSDGNVYLAGLYAGPFIIEGIIFPGGSQSRIFLMKFNNNGELIWAKSIGNNNTYVNAIEIDSDNNIFLGGNFQNSISIGDSIYTVRGQSGFDSDMLLIKLSSDGEVLSVKNPGSTSVEFIYDLSINSDGIYVAGHLGGSTIEFDSLVYNSPKNNLGCIFKYSHSGELEWINTINAPLFSESYSVTTNMDGEAIVASLWSEGNFYVDNKISIAKFSANGKLLNNQLINNSGYPDGYVEGIFGRKRMDLTSNDRCVYFSAGLTGNFNIDHLSFNSIGEKDIAIIKFNEVGYPQWLTVGQGTDNDEGLRLSSIGNNIYVAGDYASSHLSFDDLTINNNSGNNDKDFFLTKLTDTTSIILCPDIDSLQVTYPSIICEGDSVLISIDNSYATYTKWFRNEESLNYDNEKQIFIKEEGIYKVLINENSRCPVPEITFYVDRMQNQDENTDITIYAKPQANIEGTETVCLGETLFLSTPSDDNYIYSWIVPEMLTHSDTTGHSIEIEMTVKKDSMVFYVEVLNELSGCMSVDSLTVNINPTPILSLHKLNNSIWLQSSYNDSVIWYFDGNELPEFANCQSIEATHTGYYYVKGTNVHGCESVSDSIYIDVISIGENIESDLIIYPNPVGDNIVLYLTLPPSKIELTDVSGALVKTFYNESILSISELKKGLYILKIHSDNAVSTFKIIKK
ncbi:MAG: T9SS type A sorting domain-containing protein [Bacteroidales bacterium]|nr:T9SS type A sorting domain-containing protein [Bacteroidales bacterium]